LVDRFYEYARENLEELKIWKDDQDGIHVSFTEVLQIRPPINSLSVLPAVVLSQSYPR